MMNDSNTDDRIKDIRTIREREAVTCYDLVTQSSGYLYQFRTYVTSQGIDELINSQILPITTSSAMMLPGGRSLMN
jgi:hypothetical protein